MQTINLHATYDTDATGSMITRMCYRVGNKVSPTLHFNVGDTINVRLFNDLPSPDTVPAYEPVANRDPVSGRIFVRHFAANTALPDETNLHVHGLQVSPFQDNVLVPDLKPAENSTNILGLYTYNIMPQQPSGMYWYHAHLHMEALGQVSEGLTGAIVTGPEPPGPPEHIMVVRDNPPVQPRITPGGFAKPEVINPFGTYSQVCTKPTGPQQTSRDTVTVNNILVPDGILGVRAPWYQPPAGSTVERWRIVNTSSYAFLNVRLADVSNPSHLVYYPFLLSGMDGNPISPPIVVQPPSEHRSPDGVVIPPAGRADVDIDYTKIPARTVLLSDYIDTGCGGDANAQRMLVQFVPAQAGSHMVAVNRARASTPFAATSPSKPAAFSSISARPMPARSPWSFTGGSFFHDSGTRCGPGYPVDHRILFTEYGVNFPDGQQTQDFYITDFYTNPVQSFEHPYAMNTAPDIQVRFGDRQCWVLENWTNEIHAFHIHQIPFVPTSSTDPEVVTKVYHDVVTLPIGYLRSGNFTPGTTYIVLDFGNPDLAAGGDFVFHCHLLEHEDKGMMGIIHVCLGPTPCEQVLP